MTPARYSRTAMLLHWGIAAALAFQFGLGLAFEEGPKGKALFDVAQFHKSIGITILLLSLARLAVRFAKPRPLPMGDKGWAERLASFTHIALYAFMILAPLTGWLATSTSRFTIPTYLFNTVPWPDFPFAAGLADAAKHSVHQFAESAHVVITKLGMVLFLLHVAGALRHQWLLKEALIERMVPVRRTLSPIIGSALIVALFGAAFALLALGKMPGIAPAADASLMASPKPVAEVKAAAPTTVAAVATPAATEEPAEGAKPEDEPDTIAAGETPRWALAPGGRLGFATSWSGSAIMGSFGNWSADIRFNPDALPRSRISVTIPLSSVASGDGERDGMLKGGDFFDTANHPKAVWTSTAIRALGGNRYRADGSLSLRGVSKPVPLTFTLDIKGKEARAIGSASLNRSSFGVGQGDFAKTDEIPDPVRVSFSFRAKRP